VSSANVRSIQALEDLRTALTTFSGNAQESLRAATIEAQRTLEYVAERERYWRGRVTNAEEEVRRAAAAFTSCRSQVYRDSEGRVYQPPCTAEQAALSQAQAILAQARQNLQVASGWYSRVQQASAVFQQQMQRMTGALNDLPKATAMLSNKVNTLKGYTAMTAPSGGGGGFGGSAGGAGAGIAGVSGIIGATGAASAAPGSVDNGFSAEYMHAALTGLAHGATTFDTFEHLVLRGQNVAANGDPVLNLPLRYVPLSQIDASGSYVQSAADFTRPGRASPAEMSVWYEKLQRVVAPGLAQGATGDDFQRLDESLGLVRPNGYQTVFEVFYGGDAIRLSPAAGGGYIAEAGFHRLYVAQQLGLPGVPAHIVGGP
jgi:hypothetical protein